MEKKREDYWIDAAHVNVHRTSHWTLPRTHSARRHTRLTSECFHAKHACPLESVHASEAQDGCCGKNSRMLACTKVARTDPAQEWRNRTEEC